MKPYTWILLILLIYAVLSVFGWMTSKSFGGKASNQILAENLQKHVYYLSHEIGARSIVYYQNLEKTATYITKSLESFGYTIFLKKKKKEREVFTNIIAIRLGTVKPAEQIIIGAHYDTFSNPGADDNASGIAALLELARLFVKKKTQHTIKFIAFVNEEPPFFKSWRMGSKIYTRAAKTKNDIIKATIIFEMLGFYSNRPFSQKYPPFFGAFFPNKANFIAVVGNLKSKWLVKQITASFKKVTDFPIESLTSFSFAPFGTDFSDHWSFWQENYSAVMITDTAFYRNPHYHRQTDTYEKLNYQNMAEITRAMVTVIEELDMKP